MPSQDERVNRTEGRERAFATTYKGAPYPGAIRDTVCATYGAVPQRHVGAARCKLRIPDTTDPR